MEHPESEKPDAVSRVDSADADESQRGDEEFPPPPTEGPGLDTDPEVDDSEPGYGA